MTLFSLNCKERKLRADNLALQIKIIQGELTDTELCLGQIDKDECLDDKELLINNEMKKIKRALLLMYQARSILSDCPDVDQSSKSCHSQRAIEYAAKFIGTTINKWLIKDILIDPENKPSGIYYRADCQCGKESVVLARSIRNGNIKSCGCSRMKLARSKKRKEL
jgi:hypothetical protein